MNTFVKLNSQTAGRDKLARLIQYTSRLCWYNLQQRTLNKTTVDVLKNLEFTFSTFRKLLRLGKSLDTLYSTLSVINHPDLVVRITVSLSKISSALFLLGDHIIWIGRSGLMSVNSEKWTRISNKYWLYAIVMNLVRDFYEILRIIKTEKMLICPPTGLKTINDIFPASLNTIKCIHSHKDVFVDTVKNTCDFWIPLTSLGYAKLSPGTIGALGVISSIAGLVALIEPLAKLTPV